MSVHVPPGRPPAGLPSRLVGLVLLLAAGGVLAAWLAVSLVHLDDRERVNHVQGAWMALARYVNEGALYPPLFDGERYGGTRWMPLGIVLHAAAARVLGSELVGGKALVLVASLVLVALTLAVLRRLRCPWPVAAALSAALLASGAGLFTTTTIGGDVLAVVLQAGALLLFLGTDVPGSTQSSSVLTRSQRAPGGRRLLVAAGVLAGLGPLAKLTAGWAALAILCRLAATRRWRDGSVFLAAAAGTSLLGLAVTLLVSQGRLWDSVGRVALAGGTGLAGLARGPNQVVYNLTEFAPGLLAVVPLALGTVVLARGWRDLSVIDWALGWAALALIVVYTDVGTGLNQLLDVLVLLVFAAGQLPERLTGRLGEHARDLGVGALAAAALTALAAGVVISLVPALRTAADVARHGHPLPTVPLADLVDADDTLLSEDPYVPVALGRDPLILDAFMVRRLDELAPELVDPLVDRIDAGAFDFVVLRQDLGPDTDDWWRRYHFGLRVVEALRRSYEPMGERDGYLVYRPRG